MTFEEVFRRYKEECDSLIDDPPAYLYEKQQGEFTIEDFENMPETKRIELIDGEFVYMGLPTAVHQRVLLLVAIEIDSFSDTMDIEGRIYPSLGVQLDPVDNKTELVPDLIVVCDYEKETELRIVGAPDLVIEILLPETKHWDLGVKKRKYQESGVREYWIVDLENNCVTVHQFEAGDKISLYTLEDKIPVSIYKKERLVDFKNVMNRV